MSTVKTIASKLQKLYSYCPTPGEPLPRYLQTQQWSHIAIEYLAAAEYLSTSAVPLFMPWFQVVGHSIECCLKAYLCAVSAELGREHDLVRLADAAVLHGLEIHEHDVAMLVHVNHVYSKDLRSQTRYKARYPAGRFEVSGGSVPSQERLTAIIEAVLARASIENERLNAPSPPDPADGQSR